MRTLRNALIAPALLALLATAFLAAPLVGQEPAEPEPAEAEAPTAEDPPQPAGAGETAGTDEPTSDAVPATAQEGADAGPGDEPAGTPSPTEGDDAPVGTAPATLPEPTARDDSPFPPPVHQTRLEAVYDPDTRRIDGRERLRWHNTSSVPVEELRFHLYLNAFSSNLTTFMYRSGGKMRGAEHTGKDWGWIEVESMLLPNGTDLVAGQELLAPEDGNPYDRTVARYPLPEALPPGGWIVLDIAFTSQLPSPPFARTGAWKDYVLAGQWYPKIAVFEDAGDRGREEPGWNAHQFHPQSEFYADFGDYDVTLDLPERYAGRIGATGKRVEETVADGRVTQRYVQRGVHDFAWTADPDYLVRTQTFDPRRHVPLEYQQRFAALLGVDEEELALQPVEIELFLQPDHANHAQRYLGSALAALRGYGVRLGAYPYDTLTLVDPATGALGSGGMEYPTFITLGTHPLLDLPPFSGLPAPELVTVHEFGHQYFQGMIANNEFEESWIDEGINSYYEHEVMEEAYGDPYMALTGLVPMRSVESLRAGGLDGGEYRDPVVTPSWRFLSGGSYGLNSYDRPALVLNHLERLLGRGPFARALRDFFQTHRFTHPTTADFETTIRRHAAEAGVDVDRFLAQALHSTRNLDYAVRSLRTKRLPEPRGVFWEQGERFEIGGDDDEAETGEGASTGDGARAAEPGSEGEPGSDAVADAGKDGTGEDDEPDGFDRLEGWTRGWESSAVVFRKGEFLHPVTVEFTFDDGTVLRRSWDGEERWARWTFRSPSKLLSAEVDPDHVMLLDLDRLNNSRSHEADRAPALGFAADLVFWLQALLAATGVLG